MFESLTPILELKENLQTFYSNLGGGANGYLGLIFSLDKYRVISLTSFTKLLHTIILVTPNGTTQFIITATKK